jgi:REP element-mobilizing transposase RayT
MNTKSFDLPRHSPNVSLITAAHHDLKGTGRYFATMVTERRQPVLSFICQGGYARWTDVGQHVNNEIQALTRRWPIAIDRLAIMPDHIHLCFRVTESMDESVLRILSNCRNFAQKESGFTSDKNRLWERKYRLFVAFNREAYGRCIDYTAANPLRWWLTHHQSKILTPQMVKHEFLPREFQWQALGHLTLLDSPLFFRL